MIVHEVTNDKRSNNMLLCKNTSSVSSFFQMIQRKEIATQFTKSIKANKQNQLCVFINKIV